MEVKFTVGTLNVRGLSKHKKQESVKQWFTDKNIDILFIQETYHSPNDKDIFYDFDGKVYHSLSDSKHSRGVCTLISSKLIKYPQFKVSDVHRDVNGRLLILNSTYDTYSYSLINTYCPNDHSERKKSLKSVKVSLKINAITQKT